MVFREVTFRLEPIRRTEIEVRMGKLKNGKAAGKDEVTGEIVKGISDMALDWIWRLCNMAFESGVMPKELGSAVTVPPYKGKGERSECKNYRGINYMVGKIYVGILVE